MQILPKRYQSLEQFLQRAFPLRTVTSLGVGGPAELFLRPRSEEHVALGASLAQELGLPLTIIGYGTNVLVSDRGVAGLVIQLADNFATTTITDDKLTAASGCLLGSVSKRAAHSGLTGLEFAVGIPGSIGGALFMNAGAYGGEIGPMIESVSWTTGQTSGLWQAPHYTYAYRWSRAQDESVIITKTTLQLLPGCRKEIFATMEDLQNQRWQKQPLEYRNCGSVFKRPPGHYVGPLIEAANLKGCNINGAEVSKKHCGFIINRGDASAQDVYNLIKKIQAEIYARFKVELELEVKLLGPF